MDIKGITVRKVLVAPAADIVKEFYLSAVLDRAARRILLMGSAEGGVEIEQVAVDHPEAIVRHHADPMLGLLDFQAREFAFAMGLGGHLKAAVAIAKGLVRTMLAYDADLVEINPLAIVRETGADGATVERLVCLDAKVTLDDSALARHPELEALRDPDEEDPADREAREAGLTFIKLDGTIGCMVNGAGLAMTTMDLVKRAGGEPANFLDIGGGARADKVAAAMRIILADPKVDAILVNIFGGITRGDEVARGPHRGARRQQDRDVPMVVRIVGTNAAEAAALLEEAHFATAASLDEAAAKAVAASRGAAAMSILVGRETRLVVQGITGREGEFHAGRCRSTAPQIVAGVTPGKGGQTALDGTVPVFDTVADAVRETGANTSCIFVPAAGAPDAVMEAAAAGIATIFCITEGIPALDMIPAVEVVERAGARLDRPQLPGRHVARLGQGRDHPGLDPSRGPGRRRQPLRHADLRGGPGDDRRGRRPVHLHRHRRRPDHRDDLPRRPPAVRRRRRDRGDRAHRRDRRRGRGGGRGAGPPSTSPTSPRSPSSPAGPRPRASGWATPARSSRAAPARRPPRSRRSRPPGSASRLPTELPALLATPATAARAPMQLADIRFLFGFDRWATAGPDAAMASS